MKLIKKMKLLLGIILISAATANAASLDNELTDRINLLIQSGLGIYEKAPTTEYQGKKYHISVIVENSLKHEGKYIIAARFEVSVDGKLMPQLTNGAIGIGENTEDSKKTLLNEWLIQYGIPWINYLKQKDSFQFKGFTVYTGATGFRGDSPSGWMKGTNELHKTILEGIGTEIISNSDMTPSSISIIITVNDNGVFDGECRLNGKVSNNILNKLKKVEWSTSKTGYMLKQFYVVVR